jgi:hypothetical protein
MLDGGVAAAICSLQWDEVGAPVRRPPALGCAGGGCAVLGGSPVVVALFCLSGWAQANVAWLWWSGGCWRC